MTFASLRIALFSFLVGVVACTARTEQAAEKPTRPTATPAAPPSAAPRTLADTAALLTTLVKQAYPTYELEEFEAGDLNADGRADMVVLLRGVQPCDTFHNPAYCRKALLVLNEGFPRLRIAAANDNVVDCSDCGGGGVGDPHQGIVVKGTYFSFESLYGACNKTHFVTTFRYDRKRRDWFLHRFGRVDYSCRDTIGAAQETQETTKHFGRVRFADYASRM